MPQTVAVYLEVGRRRVFAGALDWPGWCRSGRDEDAALHTLVAYGPRYVATLGPVLRGLAPPTDLSALQVVERLQGNATTDFGAPAIEPGQDATPVHETDLRHLIEFLQTSWAAFDAAAQAAGPAVLRKGARGGGRELGAIMSHVLAADAAYLSRLGGRYRKTGQADVTAEMARLRQAILGTLSARARGEPPARPGRSGSLWTPRYFVRRSAWHALDHAWEIEDRVVPQP